MDAVELPFPAAVAVSKLLSAEGFGREGISVGEAEVREPTAKVSIFGRSSVARCGTSNSDTSLEQNSLYGHKNSDIGLRMHESLLPSFGADNPAKQLTVRDVNSSPFLPPKCMGKQSQRKAGKSSKSSSPCSKRQRTEKVEGSMSQAVTDDGNVISGKHGSSLLKCTFAEKSRVVGQKHGNDGKRGDKRNFKAPTKTKFDTFFSKAGLVGTSLITGGDNILGMYGLKSDNQDVTKHVDELSLSGLLDGNYKYPNLCEDKGKKAANTNENLLHIVRKACGILQPWKSVQSKNSVEVDNSSNRKMDTCLLSSGSSVTSGTDSGKGDNYLADFTSSSKDSFSKPGAPTRLNTSPLYQPKEILERLALPPAKDLDSLLLDTSKPTASSRSTPDQRLSKMIPRGASLPAFPWSHCFNGPSKTVIDTAKLSTNKSTGQGRWVKVGSTFSSLGDASSCFSDLDSLTYDHKTFIKGTGAMSSDHSLELKLPQRGVDSLDGRLKFGCNMGVSLKTPEAEGKLNHHENDVLLISTSPNNLWFQENANNYIEKEQSKRGNNGDSTYSSCNSPLKCTVGGCDQFQRHLQSPESLIQVGHSPSLLAAAQTLYEMASHSSMQTQKNSEKIRWPKKPSQKTMKAQKSRSSTVKTDVMAIVPKSGLGPADQVKITNQILPAKKPRFSTNNKKKDIDHVNNVGRVPLKWSIPTSTRSPPSGSEKHSVADTKQ